MKSINLNIYWLNRYFLGFCIIIEISENDPLYTLWIIIMHNKWIIHLILILFCIITLCTFIIFSNSPVIPYKQVYNNNNRNCNSDIFDKLLSYVYIHIEYNIVIFSIHLAVIPYKRLTMVEDNNIKQKVENVERWSKQAKKVTAKRAREIKASGAHSYLPKERSAYWRYVQRLWNKLQKVSKENQNVCKQGINLFSEETNTTTSDCHFISIESILHHIDRSNNR